VTEGDVAIKVGAVRLSVGGGDQLAAISGDSVSGAEARLETSNDAGAASVTVSEPSRRTYFLPSSDRTLNVALDRTVTWRKLQLDVGAVKGEVDLSELTVQSVEANVGASDLLVRIGDKSPEVGVDISGGATSVTVLVPAAAEVKVDATSGLSNVSVPSSFRRLSGVPGFGESTWTSDGSGGPSITIAMQSGVANLVIETY